LSFTVTEEGMNRYPKNHLPYNLYCVGGDVKPCSIQSTIQSQPDFYYLAKSASGWISYITLHRILLHSLFIDSIVKASDICSY